jgi:hypothetical protein
MKNDDDRDSRDTIIKRTLIPGVLFFALPVNPIFRIP